MTRRIRGAFAALIAASISIAPMVSPASAASWPVPRFDYTMPDLIGPLYGVLPANGPVPQYDFTDKFVPQTPLSVEKSAYGATNYGSVPEDGRYTVNLDACASTVGPNPIYEWTIAGIRKATEECATTMRLPEGDLDYSLQVIDGNGSATVTGTMTVKNVLIAITGDSYASGEGFPPIRKANDASAIDWDFAACDRSRWSGFIRAAAQVEAADPRSNVTVIDVACSGATVPSGVLGPQSGLPSQVQQLNDLRNGQQIDQIFLSIGGNDIGFSTIITTCLLNFSSSTSCFEDLTGATNTKLVALVDRYADVAACFGDGDCQVTVGGAKTSEPPLKVPGASVLQTAYPNLLAGPDSPDGFPANTNPDALCNVNWPGAPLRYGDSWWGYNVAIQGSAGVEYQIPKWTSAMGAPGQPKDPAVFVPFTPTADGLGKQILNNGAQYGWTTVLEPAVESTQKPGGLCAYPRVTKAGGLEDPVPSGQEANRMVFTTNQSVFEGAANLYGIVHPNERGQDLYRRSLAPQSIALAMLPVPAPTLAATPLPQPLRAPTGLKVQNLASTTTKHRYVRISFKAPKTGPRPYAYKVRVKMPGRSARTIRDQLTATSTVWKKAPKGTTVRVRVGSFTKTPQAIAWSSSKRLRVKQ
jgi:hypothetical protein